PPRRSTLGPYHDALPISQVWPLGFIAILAGWFVTEQGRQPWLVYGHLRTVDGISPVPGASVAGTLALFVLIYGIIFAMGVYYIRSEEHTSELQSRECVVC